MPTPAAGTIGSLDYTAEERQLLAKKSRSWECQTCGRVAEKLIGALKKGEAKLSKEESSMLQKISLKVGFRIWNIGDLN